jgi:hypothetical protein
MKARTKARRRAKAYRPVAPNVERTPDGRIRRTIARREQSEQETLSVVLDMRTRLHGAPAATAREREWGFVLGRMYLDGTLGNKTGLGRVRMKAGERYAESMSRFYGLSGVPFPSARAQDLFRVHSYDGDVSEERAVAIAKAARQAGEIAATLRRLPNGVHIETTVRNVCLIDIDEARKWPPHMLSMLLRGLDALILLWGLRDSRSGGSG